MKYDPMEFFNRRMKLWEAEQNDPNQNPAQMAPQKQQDPNMASDPNNPPDEEGQETPNSTDQKLSNVSSPFSSLAGKTIENMSVKKTGANAAELKINVKGYGPVSISWVNNNITFTDPKTGRVVNI